MMMNQYPPAPIIVLKKLSTASPGERYVRPYIKEQNRQQTAVLKYKRRNLLLISSRT